MGYVLRAFIGHPAAVERLTAASGLTPTVPLPQDLALVPLTEEGFDHAGGGGRNSTTAGDPFWFLSETLEGLAAAASGAGALAYVEADFFGGVGTQAAAVWDAGRLILGPVSAELGPTRPRTRARRAWPINRALRTLGVRAWEHIDEFEAADLGRHRETEDWAEAGAPPDPSGS